jgi:hypothetical protein
MLGYVEINYVWTLVTQNQQGEKHSKVCGWDGKEIVS